VISVHDASGRDALGALSAFRRTVYSSLTARAGGLFELTDALLCADGPVTTLVGLSLAGEHRRGHGGLYDALNNGRVDVQRLRVSVATQPIGRVGVRIARKGVESSTRLGRHRWVIEQTMSWLVNYRRFARRYERKSEGYPGADVLDPLVVRPGAGGLCRGRLRYTAIAAVASSVAATARASHVRRFLMVNLRCKYVGQPGGPRPPPRCPGGGAFPGQTVSTAGDYVRLDNVRLDHLPATPPPILAGVRGPRSLELSGRVADGTILAWPLTAAYLSAARTAIDRGRHAGDRTDHHPLIGVTPISVDTDPTRARNALRGAVAAEPTGPTADIHLQPLGIADDANRLRAATTTTARFAAELPDHWIDQLVIAGTVTDCGPDGRARPRRHRLPAPQLHRDAGHRRTRHRRTRARRGVSRPPGPAGVAFEAVACLRVNG
jgi:hypothetical protein